MTGYLIRLGVGLRTRLKICIISPEFSPNFTLARPLTEESIAATYNNFYEFGGTKTVYTLSRRLRTRPWQVRVEGLVRQPRVFEIDDLIRSMPLEERLYRFRCVEAWNDIWIYCRVRQYIPAKTALTKRHK